MLTEPEIYDIFKEYADWMCALKSLDLLDIDKLVPLVRGDQLCQALGGIKSGAWLKPALDIAMEWQLRNPKETDPSGGVAEVSRFGLLQGVLFHALQGHSRHAPMPQSWHRVNSFLL